jgi:8-oxo-dGTP pyrophosphatase MutT (NUDIX family)
MLKMASGKEVEQAFSAGGVVYRTDGGNLLIALCGRTKTGTWNLPKGTPDNGETVEQTALREVKEETGLQVEIEQSLGDIEYWFTSSNGRVHKRVEFFLMGERGGSIEDHDPEFDVVEWFPALQAVRTLTFPTEAEVVRRAIDSIAGLDDAKAGMAPDG